MNTRVLIVGTLLLCACDSKKAEAPPGIVTASSATRGGAAVTSSPTGMTAVPTASAAGEAARDERLAAMSLPDVPRCVKNCQRQNMARAVGADEIEAACTTRCLDQCFEMCTPRDDRPDSLIASCREDCEGQLKATP